MKALILLALLTGLDYSAIDKLPKNTCLIPPVSERRDMWTDAQILCIWHDNEGVHVVMARDKPEKFKKTEKWEAWTNGHGNPWVWQPVSEYVCHYWQADIWRGVKYPNAEHWKTVWENNLTTVKVPIAQNYGVGAPIAATGILGDKAFVGPGATGSAPNPDSDSEEIIIQPKVTIGLDNQVFVILGTCGFAIVTMFGILGILVVRRRK